jgi:beta-glucosidase
MGAALSRGVSRNGIACAKHFALNSMENKRFDVDVRCDEDVLHECYLPHFRQTLEEGGAESLMSAYNSVNGEWCGDNKDLLQGIVRDTWGYEDVIITSDWIFGTRDASKSVNAGLDVEMPMRSVRACHLQKELRRGKVDIAAIDQIVKRLLRAQLKFYARIAESPQPSAESVPGSDEHRQLAKRVATEGMVLLKNAVPETGKPILPLQVEKQKKQRLLVVGQLAVSTQTGDKGSSALVDETVVSPLEGLKSQPGVEVTYLDGSDLAAVERAASDADAVFCLVGYTAIDEGEYVSTFDPALLSKVLPFVFPHYLIAKGFSYICDKALALYAAFSGGLPGGDRSSLRLNAADERLVSAVAEFAGSRLIVGLESSGPVILPKSVRERSAAILHTGYAGCQFGNALREVLFGQAEPSGRLAYGMVESELDIADIDMNARSVKYGRFWGYRLQQQKNTRPAFPFGFGMGYGRFELDEHTIQIPDALSERFFEVHVTVRNVGSHKSSEVVQIYGGKADQLGPKDYRRVLLGFARSQYLEEGQTETLKIACRLDPLAHWNVESKIFEIEQGDLNIFLSKYEGDEQSQVRRIPVEKIAWSVRTGIPQQA